ncbi:hypothetical protein RHGRI_034878 [Rhododendron griersonianum]|uniref:Response regulatory domain-containing protein n=1 Tax=Rhododendron griersonianum TaxID=479676 RepID=A0AAV6I6A6_9ERIC|nr:hypothetical protein RHGRI_034878 [Rhododendron griersonianum]
MARRAGGECIQQRSPKRADDFDQPSSASQELHVLAVDDSHVDRKVIERLLKISSCRESGSRALQYLGLNGDKKSSVGFDESSHLREIPVVIMSSENILARIDRCLEEGAEEFLVKPVKLSDVNRLKDYVLREQGEENGGRGKRKRNQQDDYAPPSPSLSLQPT